jgi:hypothetical protein
MSKEENGSTTTFFPWWNTLPVVPSSFNTSKERSIGTTQRSNEVWGASLINSSKALFSLEVAAKENRVSLFSGRFEALAMRRAK